MSGINIDQSKPLVISLTYLVLSLGLLAYIHLAVETGESLGEIFAFTPILMFYCLSMIFPIPLGLLAWGAFKRKLYLSSLVYIVVAIIGVVVALVFGDMLLNNA